MTKLIVNVDTGKTTQRELNAEELAQQAIDATDAQTRQAEVELKATARQALLNKLGITAEEAQLLLGGN